MNPKGKRTIGLCVPGETELTGKTLKTGIQQLYNLFADVAKNLKEKGNISPGDFREMISKMDRNLIQEIEKVIA